MAKPAHCRSLLRGGGHWAPRRGLGHGRNSRKKHPFPAKQEMPCLPARSASLSCPQNQPLTKYVETGGAGGQPPQPSVQSAPLVFRILRSESNAAIVARPSGWLTSTFRMAICRDTHNSTPQLKTLPNVFYPDRLSTGRGASGHRHGRLQKCQVPPLSPRSMKATRSQSMHSHCVRCMPIARAAPRDRSSVTPRVNGPRSLITTVTEFPF